MAYLDVDLCGREPSCLSRFETGLSSRRREKLRRKLFVRCVVFVLLLSPPMNVPDHHFLDSHEWVDPSSPEAHLLESAPRSG